MNSSRQLATILIAGGLLAAGSAFAQGQGAGANSSPHPSPSRPITPPPSQVEPPSARSSAPGHNRDLSVDRPASPDGPVSTNANPRARQDRPSSITPALPEDSASTSHRRGTTTYGASQFKTLDLDNDGRLSRSEFIGSVIAKPGAERSTTGSDSPDVPATNSETEFAVLDADKDGYLSQSELASAHAKMGR
jgi:hypothetical protein